MKFIEWLFTRDDEFKKLLQDAFILFNCTDILTKNTDRGSQEGLGKIIQLFGQKIVNEYINENKRLGDWLNEQLESNPVLITVISSYYATKFCKEFVEKYGDERLIEFKDFLDRYLAKLENVEVNE